MNNVKCPKCLSVHGIGPDTRWFYKGQRVRGTIHTSTKWFVKSLGKKMGTVVGFSRHGDYIVVLVDGRKTPSTYWPGFWEPVK